MPGMDIRAGLTVVGDGPVGPVGRKLEAHFGMPEGRHHRDWAVGMKMVMELPPGSPLAPGTVIHTLGYPEPEIFGFLYVYPGGMASAGIFVPSWLRSPVRTAYRYLQHWMRHPYLWRYLEGGAMRSWGAKTLAESGRRGEPYLAGDGYARIGEGSGSTNVLTGSGVDEAWTTGVQLAEGVIELSRPGNPSPARTWKRPTCAAAGELGGGGGPDGGTGPGRVSARGGPGPHGHGARRPHRRPGGRRVRARSRPTSTFPGSRTTSGSGSPPGRWSGSARRARPRVRRFTIR